MSAPEPPPRPPLPPTQRLGEPVAPLQPRPAPVVSEQVVERVPREPPAGWISPAAVVLVAVLTLIVGALVGYLIGHHSRHVTVARGASGPAVTHTVTRTVVHPQVSVHTVTARTVEQTPAPANAENEARRREAEANTRTLERENEELRRASGEAGG
jgi:hypothetical protein